LLLVSCSAIHIKSNNQFPVSFEKQESHTKEVTLDVTREFFLWGLVPTKHEIIVDDEFVKNGHENVADLMVTGKNTHKDVIWSLVTFGLYMPQTYQLTGKVVFK
jgi:hypothetical protein